MRNPRTIKSFIKMLIIIRDLPLTNLKGYDKLTDKQAKALGGLTADVANDMSEQDFESLIESLT